MEVVTYIPNSVDEALEKLREKEYWIFAGGTDLMIRKRQWHGASRRFKKPVMFIQSIKALQRITFDEDYIYIGATASLRKIAEHPEVPEILKKGILKMASPPIRNVATLGGNICNAAKVGDTIPILFLLDARVEVIKKGDRRLEKISDFIKGKYETDLRKGELLYRIWIPRKKFTLSKYYKLGLRHGDVLSKLTVSCVMSCDQEVITDFRVAFGAINNKPIRDQYIEKKILHKTCNQAREYMYAMIKDYERLLHGESDKRSTREYREKTAINLLHKFLKEALYE